MNNYQIIDVHNHIFKEKIAAKAVGAIGEFYHLNMSGAGTPEDLLSHAKNAGITKMVVHSAATRPSQVQAINDFIYKQSTLYSEFIGFATLHPHMENMDAEIKRITEMGFKGIKLHPDFQEFNIDELSAMEMYVKLQDKFIVLFHTGDETHNFSSPAKLAHVVESFPQMKIIAAHLGGYSVWSEAQKNLYGKNLYIDTSSSLFALSPQTAVNLIRSHGTDKVLYGTDYPMWLHEEEINRFMQLPLTEEERKAILHDNAARLLEIKD